MRSRIHVLSSSSLALLGLVAVLAADAAAQGSAPRAMRLAPADASGGPERVVASRAAIDVFPGALAWYDNFGTSVADLGDLDGDGRVEVAVGAIGDDAGTLFDYVGAVYVLSLEGDGSVTGVRKIAPGEGGFTGQLHPTLSGFGFALEALGDLDGDGVGDLAVGAYYDGSVWILFLEANGTVREQREIARSQSFGSALALLGDLDGDGRPELAVGHPADDGERGTVALLSLDPDGSVHAEVTIGQGVGGFGGTLEPDDYFGSGLSEIADLDGDGVPELAVGAYGDSAFTGAVWVLFLNADGSVKAERRIDNATSGFTDRLARGSSFGLALAALDDADGDGLAELAVGAPGTEISTGAVWVLFLDSSGGVKKHRRIGQNPPRVRPARGFLGPIERRDSFGRSLAVLDDLDGDGVRELAIGASGDATPTCAYLGSLWLLYLDERAFVRRERKLAPDAGLPIPVEPRSLASAAGLGDLDGDGRAELALGVATDCFDERGVVWIATLADSATVASMTRIGAGSGGFDGFLAEGDRFGAAVAALGDLDLDGVADLAVGAPGSDLGGFDRGVVWILFLEADGSVREGREIGQALGGFTGALRNRDGFGAALGSAGDLDGDGIAELAVGAPGDDDGGVNRGALWILFLQPDGSVSAARKISQTEGGFPGALANNDAFGSALAGLGDLDGDHVPDLVAGAPFHDTEDPDAGVVWTLLLDVDGSVKSAASFDPTQAGHHPRQRDLFGSALANLGDLDLDGQIELVVGSPGDDGGPFFGDDEGVIWRVALAADGSASSQSRVLQVQLGIGHLQNRDGFGAFLAPLPDLNGDGIPDLGVGHDDFFRLWVFHQDGLARSGSGRTSRR